MVERIKKLASDQGITIAKLESELGLSNGIIGKWKSQEPSAYKLLSVANYLNSSVDFLLKGDCTPNTLNENEKDILRILHSLNERQQIMLIGAADSYAKTLSSYSKTECDSKQEASNKSAI